VATVDAVARRLLELAAPVRFDVVSNADELEAVYRLRYEVVVEWGWASPADMPGGVERDRYDDFAVHIAAWDGGELAAAQRLVFPQDGLQLPTEEAFALTIEPRGRVVDVGRSAIAARYRGDSRHLLLTALQGRSWLEWRSRGFQIAAGVLTEEVTQIYRDVGLEVEILGPARDYWGDRRQPARFDASAAADRLRAIWGSSP
jgi:predicted GNAT family N-acyltransferase